MSSVDRKRGRHLHFPVTLRAEEKFLIRFGRNGGGGGEGGGRGREQERKGGGGGGGGGEKGEKGENYPQFKRKRPKGQEAP